jgi:hypothetical protein
MSVVENGTHERLLRRAITVAMNLSVTRSIGFARPEIPVREPLDVGLGGQMVPSGGGAAK